MLILGEYYKPQKCKECDYSDICDIIEVPSEEVCEAIRSCTKEFLYEKIYDALYDHFIEKEN
jgi:hypothetical protein